MQERGFLYETRWKWLDYISTGVIRQIFYSVARRPRNLNKVKHLISSVQSHGQYITAMMKHLISVEADEPFRPFKVVEIMINEETRMWLALSSMFCYEFTAGNSQVLKSLKCYSRHNAHHYCLREPRCVINHIFGSLQCCSYIHITHFQAFTSLQRPSYLCETQPPRHEALVSAHHFSRHLFRLRRPRRTPAMENWPTCMTASTSIHRQNTSSLLSLHSHHLLRSPLPLSPFCANIPATIVQQNAKILESNQARPFILLLTFLNSPSHIDLFPTLRQDWTPRATSGPPTG